MATTSSKTPVDYDYLVRLLLIGDSCVGKSSLLLRFSDGSFTTSFISTIGIDFKIRTINLNGERIKLQIWDTAGQERFLPITEAYYKGTMGVLLVYDVTNETSFYNISKWMNKFDRFASNDAQIILVGNKADMDDSKRVVSRSRGQEMANEYGIRFYETSAKSNLSVEQVFIAISEDILQSKMEKVKEGRLITRNGRLMREKALKRPIDNNESNEGRLMRELREEALKRPIDNNESNEGRLMREKALKRPIDNNESNEGNSEAEENSTTTLSLPDAYKINSYEIAFNIGQLVEILSNGNFREKKDAITALFNLSILHENSVKIVKAGAVKHLLQLMDPDFGLDDDAIAILAKLAAVYEGRNEIVERDGIPVLLDIVASGSEKGKEYAVDALMKICMNSNRNCRLVLQGVIIPPLLALTQSGTLEAMEKAQALLDYFKRQRPYPRTYPAHTLSSIDEHIVSVADTDSFGSSPRGYSNSNFLWPSSYLLDGENRSLYLKIGVPLYNASLNGDWETAKKLIDENYPTDPWNLLCCSITNRYETALHVAAGARQVAFVEELLKLLEPTDLKLQDRMGNTAFCLAAAAGAVPIAKMLIEKNPDLLYIPSIANITPLYIAAAFGHHSMAWFLYHQTRDQIQNREGIFFRCIDTGLFDLALVLLEEDAGLAVARNEYEETALHLLAQQPSIFSIKNSVTLKGLKRLVNRVVGCEDHTGPTQSKSLVLVRCIFKHILNDPFLDIGEMINRPTRLLFEAARIGNYTFLAEFIRLYPEIIWEVNDANQTIFHIAVLHRHLDIFNQIHKIGSIKDEIVTYESNHGDNILHLAAKIPPSDRLNIVSGAALQMHQELLWFKEVKSITPLLLREKIGSEELTPRDLFIKEHKNLLQEGEKWMKNTARSCMIVATLITTVVFAAAFSVPGGNNDTGTPIQINETLFHVFAISDAMALSSSIISSLMFLYILTSRYAEEDFLESLPFKLMVGLATLFISMIAMMVAFMATFFIAYHHHKLKWVPFLSSSFLFVPGTLFVMLQSPLFRDIFRAACWGSPFQSGGFRSKQARTLIPQGETTRSSPPQAKFSD